MVPFIVSRLYRSDIAVFFKMRVVGVLHTFQFDTKQVLITSLIYTSVFSTRVSQPLNHFVLSCLSSDLSIVVGRRNTCCSSNAYK